jgi:alpha-tubulin suppressor-like RCC1 family protein
MKQKQLGRSARSVIGLVSMLAMTTQAAPTVIRMSAGATHTLFVESDGSLWGMGDNSLGELGQGFGVVNTNIPLQIVASNVTAVAGGTYDSLFLENDGSLWGMGYNRFGQLGDGTSVNHYFPERLVSSDVDEIAAGSYHSLFRTSVGSKQVTVSLLDMGWNGYGQLGDGSTTNHFTPEPIQSTVLLPDKVIAFSGGYGDSFFVRFDGSLWGTGANQYGQLGDGTTNDHLTAIEIETNDVTTVAAGGYHSLFLKSDGGLWAMGSNGRGQLGDNTVTDRHSPEQVAANVTAIAAGSLFSLFIKADGSLWGMGANGAGQLGDGTTTDRDLPVQVVASNVVAIAAAGDPTVAGSHSLFLKSDGSLWAMGFNYVGQLGDGTYTDQHFPVRIVPPPPTPVLTGFSFSGNNVTLNASNGLFGATYCVITSTDITLPPDQWTSVTSNRLSADGNFTIIATNAVIPGVSQQFFRIQLPY